jgi:hypothetical protein
LRAAEIAKLNWSMVLDARGRVADTLCVEDVIAKRRAGRRVPLHPELRDALTKLLRQSRDDGPIIVSARGGRMRPNSIVNWFVAMFRDLCVDGCSSHSGRRTFAMFIARPHTGGPMDTLRIGLMRAIDVGPPVTRLGIDPESRRPIAVGLGSRPWQGTLAITPASQLARADICHGPWRGK